jgi:hypothetical protein
MFNEPTSGNTKRRALRVRACFMLAMMYSPSSPVRERERERERVGKREREKEGERERERCRICPELFFLFLKVMTGALAPFSYLVL